MASFYNRDFVSTSNIDFYVKDACNVWFKVLFVDYLLCIKKTNNNNNNKTMKEIKAKC